MTIEEIKQRVADIKAVGDNDFEASHGNEDNLHEDVLQAIADGDFGEASKWADETLKSREIDFHRYCA